jgi:nitric oxide dioxygenase
VTPNETRLVQASFAQIDPIANKIAASFYGRLFELDPALRELFKTDLEIQGARFMEKLAVAVKSLEDLAFVTPFARELGRRHAGYGVAPKDYDTAGEALIWALEREFGPAFTPDLKTAWLAAYGMLCETMLAGTDASASS